MFRLLLLSSLLLVCTFCCADGFTIQNPVINADAPDPSVIRVADTYYAAATSGNKPKAYPRFRSKDLQTWELMGYVFEEWPDRVRGTGTSDPLSFESLRINSRWVILYQSL